MLGRVGSQVCFFSTVCWYPCCVSASTARCRAHTHLYITLQRTCALICPTTAIFLHSSGHSCAIQKLRLCHTSWIVVTSALTDLETRRFGIFVLFTVTVRSFVLGCQKSSSNKNIRKQQVPREQQAEAHNSQQRPAASCTKHRGANSKQPAAGIKQQTVSCKQRKQCKQHEQKPHQQHRHRC